MTFAVIKTGGKQYKIKEGDKLTVEKLEGKEGDKIKLEDVLLLAQDENVILGTPFIEGAFVEAEILEQKKAPKVIVFKYKPKKRYKKKKGHRQLQTVLEIKKIVLGKKKDAKTNKPTKKRDKKEEKEAK